MNKNLSVSTLSDKHLSADVMYQYLDNELPPAERYEVEQHLLQCDLCADAMTGLSTTTKAQTQHKIFEINYHLKSRTQHRHPNTILQHIKNWGITTAILFLVLMAALLVWFQVKKADTNNMVTPSVSETNVIPAKPLTGQDSYQQYLVQNLFYPDQPGQSGQNGTLVVAFTVNPDSSLSNLRVIKGLTPELDAKALRLIKEGPVWIPARRQGKAVAEEKKVVIPFH